MIYPETVDPLGLIGLFQKMASRKLESFDFKNYFEKLPRKAFLVKVDDEIAGYILLNQATEFLHGQLHIYWCSLAEYTRQMAH